MPQEGGNPVEPMLINLRMALENLDQLRVAGCGEPDEDAVYNKLKAVLAEYAAAKFTALFDEGRMHLIRHLAAAVRRAEIASKPAETAWTDPGLTSGVDVNSYADPPFRYCLPGGCGDRIACGQAMSCGRCDASDRYDAVLMGRFTSCLCCEAGDLGPARLAEVAATRPRSFP
jgi:hypothetical protein